MRIKVNPDGSVGVAGSLNHAEIDAATKGSKAPGKAPAKAPVKGKPESEPEPELESESESEPESEPESGLSSLFVDAKPE